MAYDKALSSPGWSFAGRGVCEFPTHKLASEAKTRIASECVKAGFHQQALTVERSRIETAEWGENPDLWDAAERLRMTWFWMLPLFVEESPAYLFAKAEGVKL